MSDCSSSRAFERARLVRNESIGDGIFELEFEWTGPAPSSGQFFLMRPARSSVLLGRAISVYGWEPAGEGPERGGDPGGDGAMGKPSRLRFLIAIRGKGTTELHDLRPGENAELTGPLGNSWASAAKSFGGLPTTDRPIALVGGGIGIAPLVHLAGDLPESSFDFFAGFRSRPYGLGGLRSRTMVVATEDGSSGHTGRIPDFLESAKYGTVYACGPEPMLRAVAASCRTTGTPALLSLERRMACGVGACLGCTVRTIAGNRRCCVDGPIFSAMEIRFDD